MIERVKSLQRWLCLIVVFNLFLMKTQGCRGENMLMTLMMKIDLLTQCHVNILVLQSKLLTSMNTLTQKISAQTKVLCAYPLCCTLSRRGLNPVMLAHSTSWLDGWLH